MRIGIDARFLTHPQPGGFKTYTQNLVVGLGEIDQENDYVLYLDRNTASQFPLLYSKNMTCRVIRGELPIVGMPFREQLSLRRAAHQDRLDLLHCPALTAPLFLSCPLVLTLHDMIWKTLSSTKNPTPMKRRLLNAYYEYIPSLAARKAATIITVSNAAKADIVSQLGISPENVVVTYEAAGPAFKRVSSAASTQQITRFNLPPEFVMAIGSADPRKNLESLLHAYARLPSRLRDLHHLVIVWTHKQLANSISKLVEALGLGEQCHFLFRVSTEEMVSLYNLAALFVFPSRYEGFGLPPLEAMSCGTAVVAANNSSLPEVIGDGGYLFEANDVEMIAHLMNNLLDNESERLELAQRGFRHSSKFSWARCARETLAVYRNCGVAFRN